MAVVSVLLPLTILPLRIYSANLLLAFLSLSFFSQNITISENIFFTVCRLFRYRMG